jgi:hypothetical protein
MKSFISSSKNVYYEATTAIDPSDVEVPQRPSPNHSYVNGVWIDQTLIPAQSFQQIASPVPIASAQSNLADLVNVIKQLQNINNSASTPTPPKKESSFASILGDKFTWKDLITILYFAGGIIGLWMHMNERIIVLEQKVVTIEKGNIELENSFKDFTVKNENQLKSIDAKISDLQQMVISRISSRTSK